MFAIVEGMTTDQILLNAFAEVRRTWDDLVTLQPDIVAGSGHLGPKDIGELEKRVDAHREAVDALADAIETAE